MGTNEGQNEQNMRTMIAPKYMTETIDLSDG